MTSFTVECRVIARRLFDDGAAALELLDVHAGVQLGFYTALARYEHISADQLAHECNVDVAFVRVWLEQQVATRFVGSTATDPMTARYRLPGPHRELLACPDPAAVRTPVAFVTAGFARTVPHLLAAPTGKSRHR